MNNSILRNAVVTIASFIFVITIVGAWTAPTQTAPNGNVSAPLTISAISQSKAGGLDVEWLNAAGSVRVGNTSATCDATVAGAIRWTGTAFEGCDGATWTPFGGSWGVPPAPTLDLVYGLHSSAQCTSLGGTVQTDGADKYCKFNGACPAGWARFKNWTQTTQVSCNPGGACSMMCITGSHGYQNQAPETCLYEIGAPMGESCGGGIPMTCYANIIVTGCY